ncbi:MAG: tetratricopeptide repeat protein [Flavobacteriaceae bacterium]|nr:tetratricopeptide repeat protein [Flavobacteriaceae bacterium]
MKKIFLLLISIISIKAEAQTSALAVADSLFQLGSYSKAISFYEKDVDKSSYSQTKIAKAYIGLGTYRKAIPYYKTIVLNDSTQLITQYELGKLYYKTKASEKAFNCFKKLIEKDKHNPNFRYQLGLVQLQAKDKKHIESFRKSVALDPYHLKSIKQLCKYFLKKSSWGSFNKYNELGLQNYPEIEVLVNYKAQACFNQQQYKKAIIYFTKLYERDSKNKFVLYRLGLANHMLMKYEEAISFYEKAIQ